jgi:hypothetical protein
MINAKNKELTAAVSVIDAYVRDNLCEGWTIRFEFDSKEAGLAAFLLFDMSVFLWRRAAGE